MHGIDFIQDFALILLVAGALGWICHRLGLSVLVGYLTAGMLVGPFSGPFALVTNVVRVETLAQVGLVFLMFSIGLRLSLRKLRRLGFSLLLGVLVSCAVVYYLTRVLGIALGWSSRECLFLAAILMVSSSAIVGKVLHDTGRTHERVGQLALGVCTVEDVVAVVMLTLLNSIVQFDGQARATFGETLGVFGAFVAVAVIGGLLLVPLLLRRMSRSAGEELQTVVITAILFGLAALAQVAGYSLALGAFLLGTIVSETPHRPQVDRVFEGMRDVFMAVFFVAMGMQLDPRVLLSSGWLVVGLAAFTLVARTFAVTLGLSFVGTSVKESLRVGLTVTTIGEFSFIIAQLDPDGGVIPRSLFHLAVGVSLLTSLCAPFLARHSATISASVLEFRPQWLRMLHTEYYGWLESLKLRGKRNMVWQLSRKRLLQISIEMLFVTGLLVFSERLHDLVQQALGRDWLFTNGPAILFWSGMTVVVLAPLVAIWRNTSALCLFFAQVITSGNARAKKLRPGIELVFKTVAGVSLYIWLATVAPMTAGGRWLLVASVLVGLVALFFFKRRLVFWHSELEVGLQDVIAGGRQLSADTHAPWLRPEASWDLGVSECVLPDLADCQGTRIMDLELRSRFGCTIVGIGRQGYLIALPVPETVLYPRDKVLLMGTAPQVEAGKRVLTAVSGQSPAQSDFEEVRMELLDVPPGSRAAGQTLKNLSPSQHYRIQVAGINRAGLRILNPSGEETIVAGDQLLILGTPDQIAEFQDWVGDVPEPGLNRAAG